MYTMQKHTANANETTRGLPLITLRCNASMALIACYKCIFQYQVDGHWMHYLPALYHIRENSILVVDLSWDQSSGTSSLGT